MLARRKARRKAAQIARLLDQIDSLSAERRRRPRRVGALSLRS